ncbi:MAG TPA: adenylyl-sulfate kinase, partial [Mycobacteriales bacterium]|nr:adenylyl-sulfate kinase [Mycobacteriales bacterium]
PAWLELPVELLAAAGGARSDDAAHHRRIRGWQQLADRLATRDAVLVLTPLWPGAPAEAVVAAARAYGADEVIRGDELPPELERQGPGATVLLTGLSGSGKSTIAAELVALLTEDRERTVTLLDGDVVRTHLSSELGFSRAHRDLNVLRIGWVAAEITKHGGLAVCAPIAPYAGTRQTVREMVEAQGGPGAFVLVYVATPLAECERRDRKGLYAQARAGTIAEFTGVSDPYDEPVDADLVIDTTEVSAVVAAQRIVGLLAARNRL